MTIFEKLTHFVERVFKTNLDTFLEALQLSPNAQGYVSGSITELLLQHQLEAVYGFEVKRIREKWEGRKHPRHHGDFYFRRPTHLIWYVIEAKGVKSNSEKWHKLYNVTTLKQFLVAHADKIAWVNPNVDVRQQINAWVSTHLPKFDSDYATPLYEYEEIQRHNPQRETEKTKAIAALRGFTRSQINAMIEERLAYVMSRVKVLETHFVSGISGTNKRT